MGGCALQPNGIPPQLSSRVMHSITTEPIATNPAYRYLDFKYLLNGRRIGGYSQAFVTDPNFTWASGVGEMGYQVGDSLYVKWIHVPTGTVYEQKVNLIDKLPNSVKEFDNFYIIVGPDTLHLYLAGASRLGLVPCAEKQETKRKNPTPDNRAAAYNCARILWKIFPEQRQLNFLDDRK